VSSVRCPKCGRSELREIGENHYLCRYCGYEFYACPFCGTGFATQQQLAGHISVHRKLEGRWVLEELRTLRELMEELKPLLEELLAGQKIILAKLEEVSGKLDSALGLLSAKTPPAAEPSDENLPDFLRGNPWLRMLGERAGGE
jgi:uncharacterized C2H2 Zn-finger protein